jgi:hypothetical protein
MKTYTIFMDKKTTYLKKNHFSPKLIYQFYAAPINTLRDSFEKPDKLILELIWKMKWQRTSKWLQNNHLIIWPT